VDIAIKKRSLMVSGHKTSVSLEEPFWDYLKAAAAARGLSLAAFVTEIDRGRSTHNLSSALRLFALADAQQSRAA
jgi:predicted DNA-binding ribbon-helix-helix protein